MNNGGLVSQYGFLYQRMIFILYVLKNMHTNHVFTFEGKDDVEYAASDSKLFSLHDSDDHYIQVKSGTINEECFFRVVGNWLLLDLEGRQPKYELAVENELTFDNTSPEQVKKFLVFTQKGQHKRKSSIARRVFEKYKNQIAKDSDGFCIEIEALLSNLQINALPMKTVEESLLCKFSEDYCGDILDYPLAKEKRLERFSLLLNGSIDNAIKAKRPFKLSYREFVQLVMQVKEEIADHKYTIDVLELKKKSQDLAKSMVEKRISREVKQLFLVKDEDAFVVNGIVHELIYKDFRDVYSPQKAIEISNLEQSARENYDSVIFSLGAEAKDPRKLFINTTDKSIDSNFLPEGPIYRKGCYVYLTGADVGEDYQITWGDQDDFE